MYIYIYMHIYICVSVYIFIWLFFKKIIILMCNYHFNCFLFMVSVYVYRHRYIFCFAFTCLHVFVVVFGLNRLGVNMHTWAFVKVERIDTDKDDVEERAYGKGMCIQRWTFFLWTWYVCHLAKPLSAYTETYCNWKPDIISSHFTIIVTWVRVDMARVVYECGRGRKCLCNLTYT